MEHLINHPTVPGAYATVVSDFSYGWVLETVIVPDECRGQGVGTELIQEVMKWCKAKNIKSLSFLAGNQDFWESLSKKFPKNIKINFNLEGELRP
jgi:N-acetylglutamate synthase-like GNAT family acetyltransferase